MRLFYYFHFERNYDVLKSRSTCFLLNKIINFNKNDAKSKMENPIHTFRETNLGLQTIQESRVKNETVIFVTAIFPEGKIFNICVLS